MNYVNPFKDRSIGTKLFSYFLCLILLSVASLSIVSYIICSNIVEQQTNENTVQTIGQVKQGLELYITNMQNIIYYLSKNSDVTEFLAQSDPDSNETKILKNRTDELMNLYTQVHPEIAGILIVNENGVYASNEMKTITRDSLTFDDWYRISAANNGRTSIISKPLGRNIVTGYSADSVLSITRAIYDRAGRCRGVILIDFKLETIKKVIQDITLGKNGFVFVTSGDGNVLYAPVNPIVYRIKTDWLKNQSGDMTQTIKSRQYKIIYGSSSLTSMKIIGVFSLDELFANVSQIRTYTFLIGMIMSLLALLTSAFFTDSIAKPIRSLRSLMKQAEQGDFDIEFVYKNHDEIGELGESFNNMVVRIKQLIEMLLLVQKSKREAELKTLEAQIKPHFLYNTLETIQWMAKQHDASDIVEIVRAMTNLFRISLNKGKEIISVSEEVKHVESYLIIQKVRYESKLNYAISCDPGLLKCKIIKLILQPIVENAIYHGIKEKRTPGLIEIRIFAVENRMHFTVRDNGAGILPENTKIINEILAGKRVNDLHGYGLQNVNERIRLTYGSEYGLTVGSVFGQYTVVEAVLPLNDERGGAQIQC